MQGLSKSLSIPYNTARRLSNGSLPGLPLPNATNICTRSITTNTARRHSICSFNSISAPRPAMPSRLTTFTPVPTITLSSTIPSSFPREITWLAGAPGAGKGTNSTFVANARGYDAPTIVVSSLLESPACKAIKDAGGMVNDEVVFDALLKELAKPEYKRGVVVDGFPRTEKQAAMIGKLHESLNTPTTFNFVTLFIDEQASVARQLSRGDSIRKLNMVRKSSGLGLLEERATDASEAAARLRYSNFMQQYEAINKLGERFSNTIVDASAPIDTVRERLSAVCAKLPSSHAPRRPSIFSTLLESSSESQPQQLAYA